VVTESDNDYLVYFHDQMHIYWKKLSEGFYFEWTFNEVYEKHTELITEMSKRGIKHIFPINNLDKVPISYLKKQNSKSQKLVNLQEQKNYSIEKKMNGFHSQIHKKGDQVKIFSEQKKDITIALPNLVENIKKLSNSDFIIDGMLVIYDDEGNTLDKKELMKDNEIVNSDENLNNKKIKFHVWDAPYFEKSIIELPLSKRIEILKKIKFNEKVLEIERKITDKQGLKEAINWATNLPGSKGGLVKEMDSNYSFGEVDTWKKYQKINI